MSVLEKVSARCDICWPCPRFPAHDGLALGSPSVRERPDKPACTSSLNRRNHCWPNKRNRNETLGGPSELSGVRQAARCLYSAGEPSWA